MSDIVRAGKSMRRGRQLDSRAVLLAKNWRLGRIETLEARRARNPLSLTRKERHELSRLGGARHSAELS